MYFFWNIFFRFRDIAFLYYANKVFDRKRLQQIVFQWQHYEGHLISFVMHISGAKFEEHWFNISRDILCSVFYHI